MRRTKRWIAISISAALVASLGATPVLAEPADDTGTVSDVESTPAGEDSTPSMNPVQPEESASATLSEDADALASENETSDSAREEGATESETEELGIELLSDGTQVEVQNLDGLSLQYDDRYDLSDLGISADSYTICMEESAQDVITSYRVEQGEKTSDKDSTLLAWTKDSGTEVAACGVGEGTVYFVPTEYLEALEETADGEETDDESETIDIYQMTVTVTAAPLTLMFLTGQSNMEGYCDKNTGYLPDNSIACTDGAVYSTYVASSSSNGTSITGGSSYTTSADAGSVAGSLQGAVMDGAVTDPLNMSGGALSYPLNSLTASGGGKTGPDSGLAYEWNRQTGDKVWVVNMAVGATNISTWVPGGTYYDRAATVWTSVLQTYQAEIEAGHYTGSKKLVFWQQGETGDATSLTAAQYESYFGTMYHAMTDALGMDAFGIIIPRAGYATNGGSEYRDETDLKMTAPRIAQYYLGSASSAYSNVFVVSNANEQWVSDSGVKSYFSGKCNYPTQSGSVSAPTTVNAVHYDIHYSQVGHNENGITAADGMIQALNGATATGVSWRDADGQTISSMSFAYPGLTATLVPVASPVYAAKSVSYTYGSGVSYDAATATLTAKTTGTHTITATSGSQIGTFSVKVTADTDLSSALGKVTGVYKYNGTWYYVIDGIVQTNYTNVADYKNSNGWWYIKNGVVDFTYTGLAKNKNGWWYVEDGKVRFDYTGFAENSNGKWYCENSKVTFSKNSVLKDTTGAVGTKGTWYYVVGSKVQTSFTGLADYKNSNGWWYIKKGVVDFSAEGVYKNKNGWWYVSGGKVRFSYNGFGENGNGKWYCEGGKVKFNKNSVIKDTTGAIGKKGTWYYVVGSKVQTSFTGLANYKNSNGWWYIKKGVVDFSAEGVYKNKNGWWYVSGGKVQFSYNGFGENKNGQWYCDNGKVRFNQKGVLKDTTGAIGKTGAWYYVARSKVQTDFTGIAQNKNGWWYIKNGKVDFSYNGKVKAGGVTYTVTNGKVNR